jgi:hypothetical protein
LPLLPLSPPHRAMLESGAAAVRALELRCQRLLAA